MTQHRLNVVQGTEDIAKIEETIDAGQIEEVVVQAVDELKIVGKMVEWKAYVFFCRGKEDVRWDGFMVGILTPPPPFVFFSTCNSWEPLETPAPKDQWNYKYNEHN